MNISLTCVLYLGEFWRHHVVLKGRSRGVPPPERTIILSHITAPKLGRRPIGNEEATIDEVI